ncbi:Ig-like domain-containing protein [Flavobacterium sp. N1994]|uniref:Ig-like domain-containing protein n=1 Tax=Flavobacterium sp. N1994 TaxID=2986827 RepID=UPI0022217D15|nr:glycosyl hydrolase family 16 [Flavobacterium sp. N1994]
MKSNFKTNFKILSFWMILIAVSGCTNDPNDFQTAAYSKNGEVFIDGFSAGLNYAAFSNTVTSAFQVDNDVTYNNSSASMRIDVPNVNDPLGSYAGGAFFTTVGRDLSDYDALTFWAKSSVAATLDVVGFGLDLGANKYPASINGVSLSTVWKKYIIPIPDASKLKIEKGMFYYSEGPENGNGYSFWIDEVKFEKLGTIAHGQSSILNGVNKVETSFNGVSRTIDGLIATFNLPNAINQNVTASPAYFDFTSSNPAVATVDQSGVVTTVGAGTAVITAKLGGQPATGSLTINSPGTFNAAPAPTENASDVISVFSNAYNNVPVDYYNGYYAPYQTTQSADFTVGTDNVLNYTNFNFVGIQFSTPTINASLMSHLHVDLYMPNAIASGSNFKINVIDWGANGVYAGGDDTNYVTTITAPTLTSQNWISLDIPFSSMPGLTSRTHLGQIIFEGTNITNFYADNIYFYNDGSVIPQVPTVAAPTPTTPAADVISIFSNAYTNVAGSDLNPNWGQTTVTTQVSIAGNNTLKYAGLNYQGLQFGTPQNVASKTFLHLDYYTANSTSLKVYLISPGPVEKSVSLTVPSPGGWKSMDIPLSSFSPVNLSNVIQMKFDGNGEIYLDNIYFRN